MSFKDNLKGIALRINQQFQIVDVAMESDTTSLGLTPLELKNRHNYLIEHLHKEDFKQLNLLLKESNEGKNTHLRLRTKSSQIQIYLLKTKSEASCSPYNQIFLKDVRTITPLVEGLDTSAISGMMETTNDFIFFKDNHHVLLAASQSMVALCEPISHWREFYRKIDYEVFPEHCADNYFELERRVYSGDTIAQEIQPIIRIDGSKGWVDNRKYPMRNSNGEIVGLYGVARDISLQVKAHQEMELANKIFENSSEGIVVLDEAGRVFHCNSAFAKDIGRTVEQIKGCHLREVRHKEDGDAAFEKRWQQITQFPYWSEELNVTTTFGEKKTMLVHYYSIKNSTKGTIWYVGYYADISAIKQHEQMLEYAATHDSLTGLPNRALMCDRLKLALANLRRHSGNLVVAFIDLDGFKAINDTAGHEAGDNYLIAVSKAMLGCLRQGDTLSRVGGDEFVAILTNLSEPDDYVSVIERLLLAIKKLPTFTTPSHCSASIGVARYPIDGYSESELLKKADQAMYKAKESGKGTYGTCTALYLQHVSG
ncbi:MULTISPECIES: diguanylate cyclase [unclassified Pseudoalteromonas]|uniref:sensor domain-containing protein n=1 Tax=unclassified Pseudoalteromonas TaxID=194690 RepID=UPI00110BF816|nr:MULTISPECIES: diguanylate cyclase [unclassified Pseudoalteromonas]TMP41981.1 hypothetical protein CWB80_19900 [Pseudoalteromonas sp. S1650]TMP67846.1 hypothetical protein CWB79_07380 [Pseudoalteromonas sp. S1649]